MINISYDTFFTVELLHKFYASRLCNDFLIVPTASTQKLLNRYNIITKQFSNTLVAYIQIDDTGKPFAIPDNGMQLSFLLQLKNSLFYNYTSLPAANNNDAIYYFTNRNNNISATGNFLTAALPAYNAAHSYSYEDLVVDAAGITFQSVNNSNNSALTTIDWRQLGTDRFLSLADLITWKPSLSQAVVNSAINPITVQVTGYNGSGNYSQNVLTETINNPANLSSFQLDLLSLQNGKYFLSINGASALPVYLNNELNNIQFFGLIDIFVENTLNANYKILANDNSLLKPVYSIYFLNRATIWEYILKRTDNTINITDTSGMYQFAQPGIPTSPTTILSQFPIPLNDLPVTTLKLDGQNLIPPSADVSRLSKNANDTNVKPVYYSEIFLNV